MKTQDSTYMFLWEATSEPCRRTTHAKLDGYDLWFRIMGDSALFGGEWLYTDTREVTREFINEI